MTRPSRARKSERGTTLTGYALLTSLFLVVSLTGIQALTTSGEIVLADTAGSVGTPRPPVEDVKTNQVPEAPPWAVSPDDGLCTPGIDGCPLGVQVPFNPADAMPIQAPLSNTIVPPANLDDLRDPLTAFIGQESKVRLNGEWTPPDGDFGSAVPITLQPGEEICSYIIHARSIGVSGSYQSLFDFPGEIVGTAYDGSVNNRKNTNDTFGHPDMNLPNTARLTGSDSFTYSGNTLAINFATNSSGRDNLRVFTRC